MSRRFASVLPSPRPRLGSVGTANPKVQFSQTELADLLSIAPGITRRFFTEGGIQKRHLYVQPNPSGLMPQESEAQLLERHRRGALELGREAIDRCLKNTGVATDEIDLLCCVSSTGFMLPGISAMYIRHLGFRRDCQRYDIVGMGCSAALNGLNTVSSWAAVNQGRYGLLVCCEVNSAIYVQDGRVGTAVVNSLFGDGCAAVLVRAGDEWFGAEGATPRYPELLGFSSHLIPEAWRSISYHWSEQHSKFELYLDRGIPNLLGVHSPAPISALLDQFGLHRNDITHWLAHAGGKKVITAIRDANGLSDHDLRHTSSVLRDLGNLGSTTVLFSYERLLNEDTAAPGDYGVMITMGPGAAVETALLRW